MKHLINHRRRGALNCHEQAPEGEHHITASALVAYWSKSDCCAVSSYRLASNMLKIQSRCRSAAGNMVNWPLIGAYERTERLRLAYPRGPTGR